MNVMAAPKSDIAKVPLSEIDVSEASLYEHDTWRPWFERLRREDPVHYTEESPTGPYWSACSHAAVMAVDTNHQAFSSASGITIADLRLDKEPGPDNFANFITMDEPEHSVQRNTVSPSVGPKNLMNLEPLIRENVSDILDHLPVGETFNWVEKVSVELTARMLATLFDFPMEHRHKLIHWSDLTTATPEATGTDVDMDYRFEQLMECYNTFSKLWEERANIPPKFDLVSMLAHGENTKDMNKDIAMFLGNILLLIVGGNDTTRNSISGGVVALNQYPDQYEKLRNDVSLIPNMVAEMIRWQTPVIHMRRTALTDTELGGKTIRKGEKVVMWYLSGNHDEDVFPEADKLIIDRPNARRHVAFGFGIHRCMGNRLAEMQLRVLWEEIMKRFKHVEVVGDVVRLPNNFIRGIADVPVQVHSI